MTSTEKINSENYATSRKVCHIEQVLVVDNCPMIQAGIRRLFAQSCFQMGAFLDLLITRDVPMTMAQHRVSLVIMELGGVLEGLRVIAQFQGTWPRTPLVVCTSQADTRLLKQLVAMGVEGDLPQAGTVIGTDPVCAAGDGWRL